MNVGEGKNEPYDNRLVDGKGGQVITRDYSEWEG